MGTVSDSAPLARFAPVERWWNFAQRTAFPPNADPYGETEMRALSIIAAATLLAGISPAADLPYTGRGHFMITPAELQWSVVASMAPPAQIAVIEGDLSKAEPFTFRLKLPAGYRIDPHTHPAYERVTVISGTLHFAHGRVFEREKTSALRQGSVAIMPPGAPMYGYTEQDTVIQVHGTGPWAIEYVNPENDPRKAASSGRSAPGQ